MPIVLEIVTPMAKVYSEKVESVVLPTLQGEVGILPGHIPLMTMLEAGELQVAKTGGGKELLAVDKGFAEVKSDQVTVVTEAAINVDSIDLSDVEEARFRAEAALKAASDQQMDPEEVERLEAQVNWAVAQLNIKKKKTL